jgi:hypothetical protein
MSAFLDPPFQSSQSPCRAVSPHPPQALPFDRELILGFLPLSSWDPGMYGFDGTVPGQIDYNNNLPVTPLRRSDNVSRSSVPASAYYWVVYPLC